MGTYVVPLSKKSTPPPPVGMFWLAPFDEHTNTTRNHAFSGQCNNGVQAVQKTTRGRGIGRPHSIDTRISFFPLLPSSIYLCILVGICLTVMYLQAVHFRCYIRGTGVLSGAKRRRLGGGHALGETRGFHLSKDGERAASAHPGCDIMGRRQASRAIG